MSEIASEHHPGEARASAPFANPATGETYRFVELTDRRLLLEWRLRPGGRAPAHRHPFQTETFELFGGEVVFTVGRERRVARQGDTVVIRPGVRHAFRNESSEGAAAVVELTPPLASAEFFETFAALARAGRTDRRGVPRNPLELAVVADRHRDEFRAAFAPWPLQRLFFALAAPLGRRLGYPGRSSEGM